MGGWVVYMAPETWRKILVNIQHILTKCIITIDSLVLVSDYVKSMSWCRRRGAQNWVGGTIGEQEREWGGKGEGGGQNTSNLGPEWTGTAPHAKEGFQVSKRDSGKGEGSSWQRGITKGIAKGLSSLLCHMPPTYCQPYTYCANCVYVVLIKELCLGYK